MSGKAAKEHVRNCSFIQVQRVSVLVRYFLYVLQSVNKTQQDAPHNNGGSGLLPISCVFVFIPDRSAILPRLWPVCNFSPCYHGTDVFLCHHFIFH